ncbi:MAG: hypothetical protein O2894_03605 [Planctomycetota bacterium]|nr:hypothetical protein [Planctomycetota bacterium]
MKTTPSLLALAAALLALALTSGCTSGGTISAGGILAREDSSGAASDGFPAPSQEMVWNAAMAVVRDAGYVPDPNLSSADGGVVETRWRTKLHPFSGMGTRERVTVRIRKVPKKLSYFKLETNVLAQANDNIKDPGNPISAEWTEGKRNPLVENMINQRVELMFLKGDASNEYRRKQGLPGKTDPRLVTPDEPVPEEGFIPGFPPIK